ncbi:MAG TPA: dihydrofolate reductase family protein [Anaerolineales bacterium]|nr:dihydrofolate reductase family protein [Anaerolineales bacterium]
MRKVVSWLFISLDGVVDAPGEWQQPEYFDQDMIAALEEQTAAEDAMLLGRVTYQEWEPYWPTSTDEPYASHINQIPKYVVSRTLESVDWGKWEKPILIKENLAEEINKLKAQPGKNITVGGSPSLVRSLLQDGLLDELKLMIHPIILGKGKRLFTDDLNLTRLQFVDSKVTGAGIVIVTYQPAKSEGEK